MRIAYLRVQEYNPDNLEYILKTLLSAQQFTHLIRFYFVLLSDNVKFVWINKSEIY